MAEALEEMETARPTCVIVVGMRVNGVEYADDIYQITTLLRFTYDHS